jgi:hypothetical protein
MSPAQTKPWEEDWATDGETLYLRGEDHERVRPFARLYEPLENGDGWAEERAELAALAPNMARMLWALEWSAGDYRGDACPSCLNKPKSGHAPDCKLQKLLGEIEATLITR